MDEDVLKGRPIQGPGPGVDQFGGLVPDHLSLRQDHLVQLPGVVIDLQRPIGVHLLLYVENGGDDMGPNNQWGEELEWRELTWGGRGVRAAKPRECTS